MTKLAKLAQSFFSKCDLDLTLTYEVSQQDSSGILMGLYASTIWLDILKSSSISDVRTSKIWQIVLCGVFIPPPPVLYITTCSVAKTLYVWVLINTHRARLFYDVNCSWGYFFTPRREIYYLKNATKDFNDFFQSYVWKADAFKNVLILYHWSVILKFTVTHCFKAVFT